MTTNPFACDSATSFPIDRLAQIYVDDYNCSNLIRSRKNLILVGERGAGKSMAFRYNSLECRRILSNSTWPSSIGVYIQCKTELSLSADVYLYDDKVNLAAAEHFLCCVTAHSLLKTFIEADVPLPSIEEQQELLTEISYSFFDEIPFTKNILRSLRNYCNREVQRVKKLIQDLENPNKLMASLHSFQSLILPLLDTLNELYPSESPHYCFMFDDAYKFNDIQQKVLNTYFSYRDRSQFSFKAAISSLLDYDFKTSCSIPILKGHDYDLISLEGNLQNTRSEFYKLASDVLKERLKLINPELTNVEDFFPVSPSLTAGLKQSISTATKEAENLFPDSPKKKGDYIYKYGPVAYYASRLKSTANHPPYSGLEIIAGISTGVLRQLLLPCCMMYELEVATSGTRDIKKIRPEIQSSVLTDLSKQLWNDLETGSIMKNVDGCSKKQSRQLYFLLRALGDLFRERLISKSSEPRAVVFSLSEQNHPKFQEVKDLLDIGRKALLIFTRSGSAKEKGRQQTYYTPNRLLWLARGLDPCGQHSRVSLKVSDIALAMEGQTLHPKQASTDEQNIPTQGSLFNA